jgi:hypothetical protein
VWAKILAPAPGLGAAPSGADVAALPVIPVFVASQTEFDLCGLLAGAVRWRRRDGRYVPGAGEDRGGYVITAGPGDRAASSAQAPEFDLRGLWEGT